MTWRIPGGACAIVLTCCSTLTAQRPQPPPIAKEPTTFGRSSAASPVSSAPRGVVAGSDGEFLFGELPAGRYAVAASAFGYLNGSYLASIDNSPVHLIDVADNEPTARVDVRLIKGATISGTVADDRGDPIVDAPVEAFVRTGAELRQVGSGVRTDDRGAYRIAQLAPGRYQVNASAGGSSAVLSIALGGRPLPDQTLVLESSDIADLVITMSNAPPHLTGSVVDANGAPVKQANVIAFPADTTSWHDGVLSARRRCVAATSTSGSFDCAGLSVGEYYIAAIDPQTAVPSLASDPAFLDRLVAGATRVTLTDNGATPMSVRLFTPREP